VLVSPEIILSPAFILDVFRNPTVMPRILSVIVDEAHVVSHWGANFRKDYGRIGMLRAHLPEGTPFVAMSATLSSRIRRDVLKKLQFNEKEYISLDIGNDRTNVSIVVRAMHNPMNTYSDLDFVIPSNTEKASDIPKTMIYCDQINAEVGIEARLDERLPQELRKRGLVRPYNAAFTPEHRALVMDLFRTGVVRILVCTDAAGMVRNFLCMTKCWNKLTSKI
jgi:superfamily II DNA helicase RecQ